LSANSKRAARITFAARAADIVAPEPASGLTAARGDGKPRRVAKTSASAGCAATGPAFAASVDRAAANLTTAAAAAARD
jgi:hypothetical protein